MTHVQVTVVRLGRVQGHVTVTGPRGGVWAEWTSSVSALRNLARELNRIADEIAPVPKHKCPPPPKPVVIAAEIMHITPPGRVMALCEGKTEGTLPRSVGGICYACLEEVTKWKNTRLVT